jgi:crossover junction endodeoxyribonuclease RusA
MKIELPLPSRNLSPNSRCHWAVLAKHKREARRLAAHLTWAQLEEGKPNFAGYRLDFYWATARRRDRDNATASCKAYLDGISDAIEQDDSEWDFDGVRFETDRSNPRLEVVFREQ